LIAGIVEAVQNTAKKIPDGMGIGLMHSLMSQNRSIRQSLIQSR
jgi:hypothetical protein